MYIYTYIYINSLSAYINIYIYTYIWTDIHTHIYAHIYRQREREREIDKHDALSSWAHPAPKLAPRHCGKQQEGIQVLFLLSTQVLSCTCTPPLRGPKARLPFPLPTSLLLLPQSPQALSGVNVTGWSMSGRKVGLRASCPLPGSNSAPHVYSH
jgi:hypothetical protein